MTNQIKPLITFVSLVLSAALLMAASAKPAASPPTSSPVPPIAKIVVKGDPYTLETCPVSGEKLGVDRKPIVKTIDGREVRFCCGGCPSLFEKDKAAFMKKLDDKLIEQQIAHYPLAQCIVLEDEKLDSENESIVNHVYKNRLVRFCCEHCVAEFEKEPAKYLTKLNQAVIAQQKPNYPLDTCPMSGEKLGANAIDHVVGVTLIRFCDEGCIARFEKDPLPVLAKVRQGWIDKHAAQKDPSHGGANH